MVETSLDFIWTRWSWEPSILLGLELAVALYLVAVFPLRRRFGWAPGIERRQVVAFMIGLLTIFIALVSPLDFLADRYLFSAHMVQHLLLILVMPPLVLVGTPGWLLRPLLQRPALARVVRWLTYPVVAFGLFNVNFWLWHLPWLYQLSLESDQVHILMHLLFMATGVLSWWPVLGPLPELRLQSYPARMAYLFAQTLPNTGLSVLLIFSPAVLYPAYALAPRLWGISPLADQQLGGLAMWIPGSLIYLSALSMLFFRWFGEDEGAEPEGVY
ncbi:MAG: cytochrome c oxidase assembly protein [Ardenticatenaceae bacterium]|nr:cytochrome c oxidase assembly protein [Ardenticatenaceae bacterium]HBY96887.1 cytochrome c oxidase assembly protein [Chloroflexota bacterium]